MSGMFPVTSFPCICYRTEYYHCVSVSHLFSSPCLRESLYMSGLVSVSPSQHQQVPARQYLPWFTFSQYVLYELIMPSDNVECDSHIWTALPPACSEHPQHICSDPTITFPAPPTRTQRALTLRTHRAACVSTSMSTRPPPPPPRPRTCRTHKPMCLDPHIQMVRPRLPPGLTRPRRLPRHSHMCYPL